VHQKYITGIRFSGKPEHKYTLEKERNTEKKAFVEYLPAEPCSRSQGQLLLEQEAKAKIRVVITTGLFVAVLFFNKISLYT